jgi:hypothetical protein
MLPGTVRNGQRLEKSGGLIARDIGAVARIIVFNILFDISQHTMPEVARAEEAMSLISSGISRRHLVIGLFNQPGPQVLFVRDHQAPLV